jgi:hypothetical protein
LPISWQLNLRERNQFVQDSAPESGTLQYF